MRIPRITGTAAVYNAVDQLVNKFDYPDEAGRSSNAPLVLGGGGGGMAHVLIVSTSESVDVQEKADFVVDESASATELQAIFDDLAGPMSIWMAGRFTLDANVSAPSGAWIRGLGYVQSGGSS